MTTSRMKLVEAKARVGVWRGRRRPVLQWQPGRGMLPSCRSVTMQGHLGILRRSCRGGSRGDHTLTPGAPRYGSKGVTPPATPHSSQRATIARVHSVARPSYQDCCCVRRRKIHARRRPCAWMALRHRHAATAAVRGRDVHSRRHPPQSAAATGSPSRLGPT